MYRGNVTDQPADLRTHTLIDASSRLKMVTFLRSILDGVVQYGRNRVVAAGLMVARVAIEVDVTNRVRHAQPLHRSKREGDEVGVSGLAWLSRRVCASL